tara:strand:+ start:57 stop:356 length:300 start_codon:yes stop_codon:yes gene_type:complete
MENIPDNWVVVKVGENLYKVLAGWSGGYLTSDSWKLNSGISEVKDDGDHWLFIGASGSVYKCRKGGYGTRLNNYGILKQLLEIDGTELMDGKTDWMKLL